MDSPVIAAHTGQDPYVLRLPLSLQAAPPPFTLQVRITPLEECT